MVRSLSRLLFYPKWYELWNTSSIVLLHKLVLIGILDLRFVQWSMPREEQEYEMQIRFLQSVPGAAWQVLGLNSSKIKRI